MGIIYNKIISSWWIFMLVGTLYTCVEGLRILDKRNYRQKPRRTLKTIEVPEDNDLIDCVDIYKQPAFSDPRIKDLKMKPGPSFVNTFSKTNDSQVKLIQNWHKYGKCPKGTIPIRRAWNHNATNHRQMANDNPDEHEYASAYQNGRTFNGAGASLSVWNPRVYPYWFHGPQTRVFLMWTNNNYETACYNLECTGFVQTNFEIALGSSILPISVYGRTSYALHMNFVREPESKTWWLQIRDQQLGYFPPQMFTTLGDGADHVVAFGGEIINTKPGNRHTATEMGSGHFSQEGYSRASFVRQMKVVTEGIEVFDASLTPLVTHPSCYDLTFGPPHTTWGSHFYFGGPGLSRSCR